MVAIEPGSWHPVGAALALANRTGLAAAVHGTPDDIPLSPRRLAAEARARRPGRPSCTPSPTAGGGWRPPSSVALAPLDELGSRPRAARFGHTLMLIARRVSA